MECPACGAAPESIAGFVAYAPGLAGQNAGFNPAHFAELAKREEKHFWFRFRNHLILAMLKRFCPNLDSVLEIGCGTGYVLSGVEQAFPNARLHGSDIFAEGLEFATKRLSSAELMQMDARSIPYVDEFDAIGAFDVLEHIEEDETVLAQIRSALKSQGIMLLTVPQHPWLWSGADERACHVRRYTAEELKHKVKAAGFQILDTTSFVSILLPAMMLSRFLQKNGGAEKEAGAELAISPWLNSLFFQLLRIELAFIKMGVRLPLGGSRLVVAKKI